MVRMSSMDGDGDGENIVGIVSLTLFHIPTHPQYLFQTLLSRVHRTNFCTINVRISKISTPVQIFPQTRESRHSADVPWVKSWSWFNGFKPKNKTKQNKNRFTLTLQKLYIKTIQNKIRVQFASQPSLGKERGNEDCNFGWKPVLFCSNMSIWWRKFYYKIYLKTSFTGIS